MIAGIDYSSRAVDIVLLDEDTDAARWHRFPLTGADAFDRARDVRNILGGLGALWEDVVAIGIEDPRGYNAGALYRIQGAILSKLPRETLVQPFPPSVWRKAVGLPGNASKGHIRQWANGQRLNSVATPVGVGGHRMYPASFEDWPQDACDAYCIALATRAAIQVTA